MTRPVTNIVVTCTKRKSVVPDPYLCLGNVLNPDPMEMAKSWLARLRSSKGPKISAVDLYQGDHWQVAKSLLERETHRSDIRLWVCSAGYGLIPADAQLMPYSATFSSGHPDSVSDRFRTLNVGLSVWWDKLSRWSGPCNGTPRTLESLVNQDPRSRLIIVASDVYLSAISDDIEAARGSLLDANKMLIFSGTGKLTGMAKENIVPCESKLQGMLGGALMSLNIRTLRWVLDTIPLSKLTPTHVRAVLQATANLQPNSTRTIRQPLTDSEIQLFLSKRLTESGHTSATSLLKDFRSNGFACEQKRFKKIFQLVAEKNCG